MITRAYLHVDGLPGSGKTAFIEAVLRSIDAWVLVARCVRDDALDDPRETAPAADPELKRYREAGASGAARFDFPAGRMSHDDFFMTELMADHSDAVVLEGDCPVVHSDLRIMVVPPLAEGQTLFVRQDARIGRGREAAKAMEQLLSEPGGAERLMETYLGPGFAGLAAGNPEILERMRKEMLAKARSARRAPGKPGQKWGVTPSHAGIEHAQLAVVNVRDESERAGAERLVDELQGLRKSDELFADVLGVHGTRTPITAVAADLEDPKDKGLRKAIARVRRAVRAG